MKLKKAVDPKSRCPIYRELLSTLLADGHHGYTPLVPLVQDEWLMNRGWVIFEDWWTAKPQAKHIPAGNGMSAALVELNRGYFVVHLAPILDSADELLDKVLVRSFPSPRLRANMD
jgi:hypothetical protein